MFIPMNKMMVKNVEFKRFFYDPMTLKNSCHNSCEELNSPSSNSERSQNSIDQQPINVYMNDLTTKNTRFSILSDINVTVTSQLRTLNKIVDKREHELIQKTKYINELSTTNIQQQLDLISSTSKWESYICIMNQYFLILLVLKHQNYL